MRYRRLFVLGFSVLACQPPTASRLVEQLSFEDINAPSVVTAPGPLSLAVRILHGACHHDVRIITSRSPGVIQLEALAEYRLPPASGGCIDIGVLKDTTLTFGNLSAGSLLIRGLRRNQSPLDVRVVVNPE